MPWSIFGYDLGALDRHFIESGIPGTPKGTHGGPIMDFQHILGGFGVPFGSHFEDIGVTFS